MTVNASSLRQPFLFVFIFLMTMPLVCRAQHGEPFDVSQCFPQMLVDHKVDFSNESLRYALLSQWNEEIYKAAKQGGQLDVLIPDVGPVGLTYEQSDEQRINEMYSKKESLGYDHDTASGVTFLDPQAGQAIRECLDAKSRHSYGFNYVAYTDTPWRTTLELIWVWEPSNSPIQVRTKTISNASVIDDRGKHPKQLLRGEDWGLSDWGSFSPPSTLVTLERENANEPIVINIETSPNVGALHIVVPPVSPKENCVPVTKSTDKYGTPYTQSIQTLANALPVTSDDGHGHKFFDYALDISTLPNGKDGIISSISCQKVGSPQDYMEFTGKIAQGSVAHCYGWWQENGRSIQMTVNWYKTGYSCTHQPWAKVKPSS